MRLLTADTVLSLFPAARVLRPDYLRGANWKYEPFIPTAVLATARALKHAEVMATLRVTRSVERRVIHESLFTTRGDRVHSHQFRAAVPPKFYTLPVVKVTAGRGVQIAWTAVMVGRHRAAAGVNGELVAYVFGPSWAEPEFQVKG